MAHIMESWFPYMERVHGEDIRMRFGRYLQGQLEWHFISHAQFDGAGGFVLLQEQLGRTIPIPTARSEGKPGWEAWKQVLRSNETIQRMPKVVWRCSANPEEGPARASIVLTEEETASLSQVARRHGVSTNTLLAWCVARYVLWEFQENSSDTPIFMGVPVNTRPPGNQQRTNWSAQVTAVLEPDHTMVEFHQTIHKFLEDQVPFALDRFFRWSARLPQKMLEKRYTIDLQQRLAIGPVTHVLFSNLGHWTLDKMGEGEGWVVLPPPLLLQPLVFGAMTVNRKLGLAVEIHPSLGFSSKDAARGLERWLSALRIYGP